MANIIKQPEEAIPFLYAFGAELGDAVTISNVDDVAAVRRSDGAAGTLVDAPPIQDGTDIYIKWSGGTDGEIYATHVEITASDGSVHRLNGEIEIRAIDFSVPVIAADPYLSSDEYVARYGEGETIRLTDDAKTGRVHEPTLLAALTDATKFADSYLAGRYTLPLEEPPELIKQIVADLARERLYRSKPLPAVIDAAKRARAILLDLSAGRAQLQLASGIVIESEGGIDAPILTTRDDLAIFSQEKMDRFSGF